MVEKASILNDINEKNLLLSFEGMADSQFFVKMLQQTEGKLKDTEPQVRLRKKVFNILVEILQNMYHYFEEVKLENCNLSVRFSLYKDKNQYYICTGNQIENKRAISLKLLLDKINALNKEELIELYRKKLTSGKVSSSGRAGLGILDIKRKAGTNIFYQFNLLNKNFSYFNLVVRINA